MALFNWFGDKPPSGSTLGEASDGQNLGRADSTRPVGVGQRIEGGVASQARALAANRKSERNARREMLYAVVRESMVRAGVLSASYKFKVLALDQRGQQFLVMMDLAREYGRDINRMTETEALIAQTAKSRHDILVTAVYWRINEHVAVGLPPTLPARAAPKPSAATPSASSSAAPNPAAPSPSVPNPALHSPAASPAAAAPALHRDAGSVDASDWGHTASGDLPDIDDPDKAEEQAVLRDLRRQFERPGFQRPDEPPEQDFQDTSIDDLSHDAVDADRRGPDTQTPGLGNTQFGEQR